MRTGAAKAPKRANLGDDFALRGIVTCACCNSPLRSSWATSNTKRYAYYLCQTEGCEAYGKSIARDKIEGEIGDLVKTLQPTEGLMSIAKAIYNHVWNARSEQAKDKIASAKGKIKAIESQYDGLVRMAKVSFGGISARIGTISAKVSLINWKSCKL